MPLLTVKDARAALQKAEEIYNSGKAQGLFNIPSAAKLSNKKLAEAKHNLEMAIAREQAPAKAKARAKAKPAEPEAEPLTDPEEVEVPDKVQRKIPAHKIAMAILADK